jgi:sugar lactone lactonase YvrE
MFCGIVNAQIISTVAGNGTLGFSGDGGVATSAELNPFGVATDASGNIYIADKNNNRIRKVNISNGIISTFAGNGTAGFSGDGGAATSAALNFPCGIATDASENIYIADANNHRIRKVNISTGIISTVAGNGTAGFSGDGGAATSAELYAPMGIITDTYENIYIVDKNNHRIRKVNKSTGTISTFAGNGNAGFSGDGGAATSAEMNLPWGISKDFSGNIYIADSYNNRIRKVNISTGVITTFAGNGTAGYSGDGGAATSAELSFPCGIASDASGNIYIVDKNNNRIRKVNISTGNISTFAGNGTAGYSGDGGAATSAELNLPWGVSADADGIVYIADVGNSRVRKITTTGSIIEEQYTKNIVLISPNPFSNHTTLLTNMSLNSANLTFYNYLGQLVKEIKNISGQTITLYRDNLSSGLYFMRLTENNKTFSINKILIVDN